MIPLFLLIAALILIYLEFFLPGGIMGTAGVVLFIGSLTLFALDTNSLLAILAFFTLAFLLLVATIRFALSRVKSGSPDDSVYLSSDQSGYIASTFEKEMEGKTGVATSDLKPSGHVKIEGKKYQVVSKLGYVEKGTEIVVVGGEGAHLIVTKKE